VKNRFIFKNKALGREAWVELVGTKVLWAEGLMGKSSPHKEQNFPNEIAAQKRRDELMQEWMTKGFDFEVKPPTPTKKLSLIEQALPDFAEEIEATTKLVWNKDVLLSAEFHLCVNFVQVELKDRLKPLLNVALSNNLQELSLKLDGPWSKEDLVYAMGIIKSAPCSKSLKELSFEPLDKDQDDYSSIEWMEVVSASEFQELSELKTLRLNSLLLGIAPGPGLIQLQTLERKLRELHVNEFMNLTSGTWTELRKLSLDAPYLDIFDRSNAYEDDEVVQEELQEALEKLRAEFKVFLDGNSFPKLSELELKVPFELQRALGNLDHLVTRSPLGKRLKNCRIQVYNQS
jgi:hypothetical protein